MDKAMERRSTDESVERVSDRWVVTPLADVYENEQEYLICADLPGVSDDGLDIQLDAERVLIHGRTSFRGEQGSDGGGGADFERRFMLPDDIDREKVSASLENGVLELHLPKSEESKPRRISIGSQTRH